VKAAETARETSHPTMHDMVKWNGDFLSKYEEVIYQDVDARQISENP
jgi:hypothetical protein